MEFLYPDTMLSVPEIAEQYKVSRQHVQSNINSLLSHVYTNKALGIILGIGGFGVMMWGWWLFKKFDTAICFTVKTNHLVTIGIYRISGNPMYLGVVSMMLAIATSAGTFTLYLSAVAYFLIINGFFCPHEEVKLAEAFGYTYISYKKE